MNMITDPREHLVVIGNGMAGMRTVEELLKLPKAASASASPCSAPSRTSITTASCCPACWPATRSVDDIVINSREWYEENGITLITGDAVTRIDRGDKTVTVGQRPHRAL